MSFCPAASPGGAQSELTNFRWAFDVVVAACRFSPRTAGTQHAHDCCPPTSVGKPHDMNTYDHTTHHAAPNCAVTLRGCRGGVREAREAQESTSSSAASPHAACPEHAQQHRDDIFFQKPSQKSDFTLETPSGGAKFSGFWVF